VTPEVAVVGPGGALLYRGRIDDLWSDYGKRRQEPTTRDLRAALDAALAGRPTPPPPAASRSGARSRNSVGRRPL
jgi:hypothetical protein